jgi:hypothetical protein
MRPDLDVIADRRAVFDDCGWVDAPSRVGALLLCFRVP